MYVVFSLSLLLGEALRTVGACGVVGAFASSSQTDPPVRTVFFSMFYALQSDLADLIPNAEERKAMSSIEDINVARAGRRIPAASALSSTSSPSASTPTATTPLGADFGLARRTMYYWPSGGLVQGPSALDAKVPAGGVDWSAGKLV